MILNRNYKLVILFYWNFSIGERTTTPSSTHKDKPYHLRPGTMEYVSAESIFLAWIMYMAIANVWYITFNSTCVKYAHNGKQPEFDKRAMAVTAITPVFGLLFFTFILSATRCTSSIEGGLWGIVFGLFDFGINVSHTFFEDRPIHLRLIHSGGKTACLTIIGTVLGALCGDNY